MNGHGSLPAGFASETAFTLFEASVADYFPEVNEDTGRDDSWRRVRRTRRARLTREEVRACLSDTSVPGTNGVTVAELAENELHRRDCLASNRLYRPLHT